MSNLYKGFVTKKYSPNGAREVARRLRQIENGQLQVSEKDSNIKDIVELSEE